MRLCQPTETQLLTLTHVAVENLDNSRDELAYIVSGT